MIATTEQLCNILECSDRVISKWITAGMPVAVRGGDGRGSVNKFRVREVVDWLRDRAVSRATKDRPEDRLKLAQAKMAELDLLERSGAVVAVAEILPAWEGAILAARTDLLGMGHRLKSVLDSRYGVNIDQALIDLEIHNALRKLSESPPVDEDEADNKPETDEEIDHDDDNLGENEPSSDAEIVR